MPTIIAELQLPFISQYDNTQRGLLCPEEITRMTRKDREAEGNPRLRATNLSRLEHRTGNPINQMRRLVVATSRLTWSIHSTI
jgi:hypothetical protein